VAKKVCCYCGNYFVPDRRVGNRQKACSIACQRVRKKENNRAFSEKNPGYWSQRYEEVKQWRQRHPDYQRRWRQAKRKRRSPSEIQAERLRKAIEFTERVHLFLREIQAEIRLKSIAIAMRKAPLILKVH
jgi:hypothetical protein